MTATYEHEQGFGGQSFSGQGFASQSYNEMEAEQEAEQFFGDAWRWLTRDGSQQRNLALRAARLALPGGMGLAGSALGGLAGPASAAALGGLGYGGGRYLASQLPAREQEFELEFEGEGEFEGEFEGQHELSPSRRVYADALMEHLGAAAAEAESEQEAEAFIGALIPLAAKLLPMAGKLFSRAVPQLIRGAGQIVRGLRQAPQSRALVRAMPTVVRRTLGQLAQQTRQGRPVTAQQAALTLARNTQRVLSSPQARRAVLQRSLAGNRAYHQIHQGQPGWRGSQSWNGPRQNWGNWGGYAPQTQTQARQAQMSGYGAPGWDGSPPTFQGQGSPGSLVQAGGCCPVCGTRR